MKSIDELFETKLADHELIPPSGAWEKLEAGLSKKNNVAIVFRWAAAILIGGLCLGIWLARNEEPVLTAKESVPPQVNKEPAAQEVVPTTAYTKKEQAPVKKTKNKMRNKANRQEVPVQTTPQIVQQEMTVNEDVNSPVENTVAEVQVPKEKGRKPIVLVYTLDAIESPEREHADEEVAEANKNSSFKKMVKIASDAKNSESPLGGIRGMKEELFAFDFKGKTTTKKH